MKNPISHRPETDPIYDQIGGFRRAPASSGFYLASDEGHYARIDEFLKLSASPDIASLPYQSPFLSTSGEPSSSYIGSSSPVQETESAYASPDHDELGHVNIRKNGRKSNRLTRNGGEDRLVHSRTGELSEHMRRLIRDAEETTAL